MIKYIFTDLDFTLLDNSRTIPENNLKAIKTAEENGVKVLFNTGRMPFSFKEYLDITELDSYVSSNGGYIKLDGKVIFDVYLKKEVVYKILDLVIREDIYARFFSLDWLYNFNLDKEEENHYIYTRSNEVNEKELRKIIERVNIYKVSFMMEDVERLARIQNEINSFNMDTEAFFSGPTFMEACPKGTGKGEAIRKIMELTGNDIKDTIAIGDNDNDITMLKAAGISCCPANAKKSIKDICDYVAESDNNDGVLKEIVEKFII